MLKYELLAILVFVLSCTQVLAWGTGHEDQAKLLLEVLPKEIQDFFPDEVKKELIKHLCHYPDSFAPFDPKVVGAEAIKLLKAHKIMKRYPLHHDNGRCLSFMLLTRAFRDKKPRRAALWMGALIHALGDECASNHDPILHFFVYGFNQYKINKRKIIGFSQGIGTDFSQAARNPEGREILAAMTGEFKPASFHETPDRMFMRLLMAGVEGNAFLTRRSLLLAASYGNKVPAEVTYKARYAMAELGMYAIRIGADAVLTAWNCARAEKDVVFSRKILQSAHEQQKKFFQTRPLSDDSIYTGLLGDKPEVPFVGVLVEPSRTMNKARFSFSAKLILTALMRELKLAKVPFYALDVRVAEKQGMPDPRQMPVAVVCSGSLGVGKACISKFQAYSRAGGRFLWIGGAPRPYHVRKRKITWKGDDPRLLGALSDAMQPLPPDRCPISAKYGDPNLMVVKRLSFRFDNDLGRVMGEATYKFLVNPNTPAGWQKPYCGLQVASNDPHIKVLVRAIVADHEYNVAAALMDDKGRALHVFLPEYLVSPYLLARPEQLPNLAAMRLDRVGRKVAMTSLRMLVPGMMTTPLSGVTENGLK